MPPMTQTMLQRSPVWHVVMPILIVGFLLLTPMRSDANVSLASGFIDFDGTLLAGTCDITSPPTLDLGRHVDVSPILSNPNSWTTVAPSSFKVELSNCNGGGGTLTPRITITGTMSSDPGVSANSSLFKTGGDSKGFGIVLTHNGNRLDKDSSIVVKGTSGESVTLVAAISAGEKSWAGAKNQNMKAGTLTAAVTFSFAYR